MTCSCCSATPSPISRRSFFALATASATLLGGCTINRDIKRDASRSISRSKDTAVVAAGEELVAAPEAPTPEAAPQPTFHARTPKRWGMDLEGITRFVPTTPGHKTLALTFDACGGGGSGVDKQLLDTLHAHAVPATLFLNARWIEANPEVTRQLIDDPLFSVQNHGTRHLPLSVNGQAAYGIAGTASVEQARAEVVGNRDSVRAKFGHGMTWFRSGTAHYDDVAVDLCLAEGSRIAGFAANIDHGAKASSAQVAGNIVNAPDGAIALGHMNHPGSGTAEGVRLAVKQLLNQGVEFKTLP